MLFFRDDSQTHSFNAHFVWDLDGLLEKCPACEAEISFACMKTSSIIAETKVIFCVIQIRCGKCNYTDWFRPDPECSCVVCGLTVRFNLPASNWAHPWECERCG